MSGRVNAFPDSEIDRIVLLTHALLSDPTLSEESVRIESSSRSLRSQASAGSNPRSHSRGSPHASSLAGGTSGISIKEQIMIALGHNSHPSRTSIQSGASWGSVKRSGPAVFFAGVAALSVLTSICSAQTGPRPARRR